MTLLELVEYYISREVQKHGLDGYPERELDEIVKERINAMSPYELLSEISHSMERMS